MKKDFLIENIENLTPREKEILEKLFKNSEDVDLVEVMNQQLSEEWIEKEGKEEISGKNFGFENLKYNSLKFGKFIFNNRFQPWLFSILFILGAIYMGYKQGKEFLFLLGWFVLLWFIYFFSWFQTLGGGTLLWGKTRFFMSFYPITVFFAGYGMLWIKNIIPRKIRKINLKKYIIPVITVILTLFFIPYSLEAKDMFSDDQQKLETKIPELAEKDIPENCVIVANWPTILKSTTDLKVADVRYFLDSEKCQKLSTSLKLMAESQSTLYLWKVSEHAQEPPVCDGWFLTYQEKIFNYTECVLFFEDLTCEIWEFEGKQCKRMRKEFSMETYLVYKEGKIEYKFYKLTE